MNESDIRKYAQLMGELGLTGLEIKSKDDIVRLERTPAPSAAPVTLPAPEEASAPAPGGATVCSPMVGLFYAAPAENADPYVSLGDHVKKGQTLCIVEAMKLMNEIRAEEDGIITEICVTNGQMVEYGTALFRIGR